MQNKVYEFITKLYPDFILGNKTFQKSIFAGVNRSVTKFMNFVGRALNLKEPANIYTNLLPNIDQNKIMHLLDHFARIRFILVLF